MKDGSISDKGEQMCNCCLKEGEQSLFDAPVCNTILSLECGCPLSGRGCDWFGNLENVENHLTECVYVYALCELMCGVVTRRYEMRKHTKRTCSQRKEACSYCSKAHKMSEMSEHEEVCRKVEVMCDLECGTSVRRECILDHKRSECSEQTVLCPYWRYGCEVVVLKRDLKQHLEDNIILHMEKKLNTVDKIVVANNAKIESMEYQLEMLTSQMEIKEKEIDFFKQELNICRLIFLEWSIFYISDLLKPNLGYMGSSDTFRYAGYTNFYFMFEIDALNLNIDVDIFKGYYHNSLKWPLKAKFTTRVICHHDKEHSMIMTSPIIEYQKEECQIFWNNPNPKRICSIPLSTHLDSLIISNRLDLEFTLRILKNI